MGLEKQGYKKLIVWQEAAKLRKLVYETTRKFPSSEIRRVSQMNDAARSLKQNIQEGYNSGSIAKYINALSISKGSLSELSGDIEDCLEDKLITKEEFDIFASSIGREDYLLMRLIQSLRKKIGKEK